jgi:hypothetical protein
MSGREFARRGMGYHVRAEPSLIKYHVILAQSSLAHVCHLATYGSYRPRKA